MKHPAVIFVLIQGCLDVDHYSLLCRLYLHMCGDSHFVLRHEFITCLTDQSLHQLEGWQVMTGMWVCERVVSYADTKVPLLVWIISDFCSSCLKASLVWPASVDLHSLSLHLASKLENKSKTAWLANQLAAWWEWLRLAHTISQYNTTDAELLDSLTRQNNLRPLQ